MADGRTGGRLTTHVLDTATGRPAAGLEIRLFLLTEGGPAARREVARAVTNADGRCDRPLLEGEAFRPGHYDLEFEAGGYFDRLGLPLPARKFLDTVVIRFGIDEETAHYHVPLLLSPFGYSTYRGS